VKSPQGMQRGTYFSSLKNVHCPVLITTLALFSLFKWNIPHEVHAAETTSKVLPSLSYSLSISLWTITKTLWKEN